MAVIGVDSTEAQQNQIPPAIRRFAQESAAFVTDISRIRAKLEHGGRTLKIRAQWIDLHEIPDGFSLDTVYANDDNTLTLYVQED